MSGSAWHAQPDAAVFEALRTTRDGLSAEDAAERLQRSGPNRLEPPRPVSAVRILVDQLTSVVVFLLVAAVVVTAALGDWVEAAAIGVVLLVNTLLGFVTEMRARRAMEALLQYDVVRATVMRRGRVVAADAATLVPGDVVELNAGQHVPADVRLIEGADLRTVEAALTGESLPISKHPDRVLPEETGLADRVNMAFKGTAVAAGTARGVVVATGASTEIGRVATLVGGLVEERTPLERRLDALGRRLVWVALAVAALVSVLGWAQGAPLAVVVETGIALAVAAVPEALPAVVTIALAVGLTRMARRRALVRRLPAVEALGSTTVVCTDKTRTLTSGEMTAARLWTANGTIDLQEATGAVPAAAARVLGAAMLASRPQAEVAAAGRPPLDPVDHAILQQAERLGIRGTGPPAAPRDGRHIPFASERKFSATIRRGDDGRLMAFVKGAPRRVLEMSGRILADGRERPLDEASRRAAVAGNDQLASNGFRVLAAASGPVDAADERALGNLTMLGLIGLIDPPAPGVKQTIAQLRDAGLRTIMLTGDQRLTAEAIGRDLGLLERGDAVLDGRELDALSAEQLAERLDRIAAFSRVTPQHKLAIVTALQQRGEVVAMFGDGVNDAAALKKADVGVAMGRRGTDVAKEAAAIVLQDDRFETIAAAVEEGRVIYENIRKFVWYLFSCNLAEVLVLLGAGVAALPLPLQPLQILWLNMITDTFPALALAMEPGDPDVMRRPPRRPEEALMSRGFLSEVAVYAVLITAATLGAFWWGLSRDPRQANTISFMTLALAQVFHLGNARAKAAVVELRRALANRYAVAAVVGSIGLQVAAIHVAPLRDVLRLVPLDPISWIVVLAAALAPAVAGQLYKTFTPAPSRAQRSAV